MCEINGCYDSRGCCGSKGCREAVVTRAAIAAGSFVAARDVVAVVAAGQLWQQGLYSQHFIFYLTYEWAQ